MVLGSTREAFNRRIDACSSDAVALKALENELRTIGDAWAGPLRLRVINLQRKLTQASVSDARGGVASSSAASLGTSIVWGSRFGLPLPDGRPLYQYRLSTENYEAIGDYLKTSIRRVGLQRQHDDALFAIWVAEWFRRSFKGGQQRWADIGNALGLQFTQAEWRQHADNGLRIWKLSPLRLHGALQRLLSLARQGGFPIAAIEGANKGWAASYLEKLVGILLNEKEVNSDSAFLHAEALSPMLPESWRSRDFFVVCADLSLAVIQLRRTAEAEGAISGLSPSLWLDASRPNWRDSLPLVVDGDAGRRLIDGLMKAVAVKGGTGAIRAIRTLKNVKGNWVAQLQLELNGKLSGINLANARDQWSRLRMFAASRLAQYLPGELAVVEAGEGDEWIAIANGRTQRAVDVPLSVPIEVELRGNGQRIRPPFLVANGTMLSSPIFVCYDANEGNLVIPEQLLITGTASGKYRPNPLYVFVPKGWTVEASAATEQVNQLQELQDGRLLWRVDGGAIVSDEIGDCYRILAGQSRDDRDALCLLGTDPPRCLVVDECLPIILGKPKLSARENGAIRAMSNGEAWWRPAGDRNWRPFGTFDGIGACEFAWRDAVTQHLRDRKAALVLPERFQIDIRGLGDRAELTLRGWPGTADIGTGNSLGENRWSLNTRGATEAIVAVHLCLPKAMPIALKVQLPHQAWITDWNGTPLPPRARFALADMNMFVARATGDKSLVGQLRDRKGAKIDEAELRWSFTDELPLNAIRDDVAALLRPLGDLDAAIEFKFNDTRGEYWLASEFDVELTKGQFGFMPTRALEGDGLRVVGRSLRRPQVEAELMLFTPSSCQPIDVPDLKGPWLLYLRTEQRVLTRPAICVTRAPDMEPPDILGDAMEIADRSERAAALNKLFDEIERDGERAPAVIQSILGLAKSLASLPASTFDILGMMVQRPLTSARLMLEVAEGDFASVYGLQDGLPFAWSLIPRQYWHKAAHMRFESILRALPEAFPSRFQLAATAIAARYQLIAAEEFAIAPLLGLTPSYPNRSDAAQQFMQREHDMAEHFGDSPFRPEMASLLPTWQFHESYWRTLDAPCAAALAAKELVKLNDGQMRCVKDVARRHPKYFGQAYIATFREQAIG